MTNLPTLADVDTGVACPDWCDGVDCGWEIDTDGTPFVHRRVFLADPDSPLALVEVVTDVDEPVVMMAHYSNGMDADDAVRLAEKLLDAARLLGAPAPYLPAVRIDPGWSELDGLDEAGRREVYAFAEVAAWKARRELLARR